MQPESAAPPQGIPSVDLLTVYGPLGIFCVILLAIIVVLWRDIVTQRKASKESSDAMALAYLGAQERLDRDRKAERDEFRETMLLMAKEGAAASTKNAELWRDHGRELRQTLESASRKIGSRE